MLLVRRRRNGKENIIIGLVLAGSVLLTGGLVSGRLLPKNRFKAELACPLKRILRWDNMPTNIGVRFPLMLVTVVVEESVEKSIPFEKKLSTMKLCQF